MKINLSEKVTTEEDVLECIGEKRTLLNNNLFMIFPHNKL